MRASSSRTRTRWPKPACSRSSSNRSRHEVAAWITGELAIPTIGIGAGAGTSGQVLVFHDLLGMFDRFTPRFVKRYAHLHPAIVNALQEYRADVEAGRFPAAEHGFAMEEAEWAELSSGGRPAPARRDHAPRH